MVYKELVKVFSCLKVVQHAKTNKINFSTLKGSCSLTEIFHNFHIIKLAIASQKTLKNYFLKKPKQQDFQT